MAIKKSEKVIAQQLIQAFSESKALKGYFKSDIEWLEDRLAKWDKNYIRVGLVGVTSSGKSTLLNAILGDDILPTAVRPSSGTLITCSKGTKTEAVVHFENGTSIRIPANQLKEQLQKYGDEHFNENNKYKVKTIDVKSPHFLFPEKIQIIDSPGLDAHGLERHEQITMEMLLPTVDLCMYVVTLKANSDAMTRDILHTIHDHQKPLIIVQNMLDSVEPKMGKGGVVLKTKEQVAREHMHRVERVLADIDPSLKTMVDIVQLSAKMAVDGRREQNQAKIELSKMNSLIQMIIEQEKSLQPKLYVERTTQILRHLTTIQDREEKIIGDVTTLEEITREQERELQDYLSEKESLHRKIQSAKQALTGNLSQLEKLTAETTKKIKSLHQTEFSACQRLLDRVKSEAKKIEEMFISTMRSLNKEVSEYFDVLNLQTKDYENDNLPSSLQSNRHFNVKKKIVQEERRQKKNGVGGKVARFFGSLFNDDWGYEYREVDVEVIDVRAISSNIKSYQETFGKHVSGYIDQWEQRSETFLVKAEDEIQRRRKGLLEKQSNLIEKQKIIEILFKIRDFIQTIENQKEFAQVKEKKPQTKRDEPVEKRQKMTIKPETLSLYQLSHHLLHLHFKACLRAVQDQNSIQLKRMKRTVIWGWDTPSLLSFSERYFGLAFTEEEEKKLENNGMVILEENQLLVVNEHKLHPQVKQEIGTLVQKGTYNAYVLFHLIQSGQAQKAIHQSALNQLPGIHESPVNCVIQSIHEFKVSRNIDEGIRALYDILDRQDLFERGEILINDKNPLYSMISLELDQPKTIIADAHEVLQKMKNSFTYLLAEPYEEDHIRLYIKALIDCRGGVVHE